MKESPKKSKSATSNKKKPISKEAKTQQKPGRPVKSQDTFQPDEWLSQLTIQYVQYFESFGENTCLLFQEITQEVKQAETKEEMYENYKKMKKDQDKIQNKKQKFLNQQSKRAGVIQKQLLKTFGNDNKFKQTEILKVLEMLIGYMDKLCYKEFANFYFSVLESLCSPDEQTQKIIDSFLESSLYFSFNYRDPKKLQKFQIQDGQKRKLQEQVKGNKQKQNRKKGRQSKKATQTLEILNPSRVRQQVSRFFHKFKDIFSKFIKDSKRSQIFFQEQFQKERLLQNRSKETLSYQEFEKLVLAIL